MSNYPPGVTGAEREFGPDEEHGESRWCSHCDIDTEHSVLTYYVGRGGVEMVAICDECEAETVMSTDDEA